MFIIQSNGHVNLSHQKSKLQIGGKNGVLNKLFEAMTYINLLKNKFKINMITFKIALKYQKK